MPRSARPGRPRATSTRQSSISSGRTPAGSGKSSRFTRRSRSGREEGQILLVVCLALLPGDESGSERPRQLGFHRHEEGEAELFLERAGGGGGFGDAACDEGGGGG